MNHPKGLTVDDRGNIYIADTMNMVIRKIGDAGKIINATGFYVQSLLQLPLSYKNVEIAQSFNILFFLF